MIEPHSMLTQLCKASDNMLTLHEVCSSLTLFVRGWRFDECRCCTVR
jgi:hypothetical protein